MRRVSHVSRDGLCRPCLQIIRTDDPQWVFNPAPGRPVQLALILQGVRLPMASSLLLPANRKDKRLRETLGDVVPAKQKWQWLAQKPAPQALSPHLVDPAQTVLFEVRRDWRCITVGGLDQLPALTPAAGALVEEFNQQARLRGWNPASRNSGTKTLRILLAWIGADAPIREADIKALSGRPGTTVRRVLQFLGERGMVIPDPARQGTAVQRTVQQRIQALPETIAAELRQWVKVARGEGRRAHRELPFSTIRSYLNCFYPVLTAWSERVTSGPAARRPGPARPPPASCAAAWPRRPGRRGGSLRRSEVYPLVFRQYYRDPCQMRVVVRPCLVAHSSA